VECCSWYICNFEKKHIGVKNVIFCSKNQITGMATQGLY
jgi:hypothetical protein